MDTIGAGLSTSHDEDCTMITKVSPSELVYIRYIILGHSDRNEHVTVIGLECLYGAHEDRQITDLHILFRDVSAHAKPLAPCYDDTTPFHLSNLLHTSHMTIPPATDTLSECFVPYWRISIQPSPASMTD